VAPQALTRTVAGLDRSGRCLGIDLGPLDHDEVAVLVEAGAAVKPTAGVLARIVGMAQGNPFFALELTRGIGGGADAAVAPSVWDAITERFLDLDDATAAMLRRLAVAGDDLDPVSVPALQERLAKLAGGVAVIKAGAATEVELQADRHQRRPRGWRRRGEGPRAQPHGEQAGGRRRCAGRSSAAGALRCEGRHHPALVDNEGSESSGRVDAGH
jgi:hypothetical protein